MEIESYLTLGIDDAGRGPVIGPMALAGCLIDESIENEFKKLGVKDSKQLSPNRRESLAWLIKEKVIKFEVIKVEPYEIDGKDGNSLNLNQIEAVKMAQIINKINEKTEKEKIKVILDCPSNNIKAWTEYLKKHINNKENLTISAEHKADVNHIAVSAASILAKTTRDREIELLKKKIGVDFGSGYPSDPVTKQFLKEYFEKHKKDGIFRETWGTVAKHKKEKEQKKLGEF